VLSELIYESPLLCVHHHIPSVPSSFAVALAVTGH